ncbi:hypothetical protein, partial [Candidatus Hakubella thermalkaliphila]
ERGGQPESSVDLSYHLHLAALDKGQGELLFRYFPHPSLLSTAIDSGWDECIITLNKSKNFHDK